MGIDVPAAGPAARSAGGGILLDTHALVWWWTDDRRLTAPARAAIAAPANRVLVSAASAWEIATKHRLGKWDAVAAIVAGFEDLLRRSRFIALSVTPAQALAAGALDWAHRDPFDRLLAAQAREQSLPLVSGDEAFRDRDLALIW